jgi:hypothetical protein
MVDVFVALAVAGLLAIHVSGWGPLAKDGHWAAGVVIISCLGTLLTHPATSNRFRFSAALLLLVCCVTAFRLLRPRPLP